MDGALLGLDLPVRSPADSRIGFAGGPDGGPDGGATGWRGSLSEAVPAYPRLAPKGLLSPREKSRDAATGPACPGAEADARLVSGGAYTTGSDSLESATVVQFRARCCGGASDSLESVMMVQYGARCCGGGSDSAESAMTVQYGARCCGGDSDRLNSAMAVAGDDREMQRGSTDPTPWPTSRLGKAPPSPRPALGLYLAGQGAYSRPFRG